MGVILYRGFHPLTPIILITHARGRCPPYPLPGGLVVRTGAAGSPLYNRVPWVVGYHPLVGTKTHGKTSSYLSVKGGPRGHSPLGYTAELIFGKGGPEGLRFHMNDGAA